MDYFPEKSTSSRGIYYSFKNQAIWQHNADFSEYNNFYGQRVFSTVDFVFNPDPEYTGTDENPQQPGLSETTFIDEGADIASYDEGYYTSGGIEYRRGFYRKQNVYYAPIKGRGKDAAGNPLILAGEVLVPQLIPGSPNLYAPSAMGIKAQFLTVRFKQDLTTDPLGAKQLFSVGAEYTNR